MRPLAALGRHPAASAVVVVVAAFAAGLLVLHAGPWPVAACAAAAVLLRFPHIVPFYFVALALLQPLVLRLVPMTSGLWILVKRADEFSLAALLPLALLRHLTRETKPLPGRAVAALGVVIGLGLAASLARGTAPYLIGLDAFLLLKGFIVFTIFTAAPLGPRATRALLAFAAALAASAGLVGLFELLAPGVVHGAIPLDREAVRVGLLSLVSIFDNAGQAGWCFAFGATACYAFYLVYRRNGLLALFGLLALCAVLTLRRKPLAGMVVALLLSVLLTRRTGQAARSLLILVAASVIVFSLFGDTIGEIFSEGYRDYVAAADPTRVARNAMYLASVRIATDQFPLGVGFGLFGGFVAQQHYSAVYFDYGLSTIWGLSPVYNRFMLDAFWPHVLGQFGFFGLLAFALALFWTWAPPFAAARAAPTLPRALGLAAALTLAEALVESAAFAVFEGTTSSVLLFGLAAIASNPALRAAHDGD